MMPCGRGASGGGAYFAPTAVRPGLSAREAGVTPALARPHDQVYFHLPLSIAPFVWRPRTSPSHGENRGSSPLGSANDFNNLYIYRQSTFVRTANLRHRYSWTPLDIAKILNAD